MKENPLAGLGAGELMAHGQSTRRRFLQMGGVALGGAVLAACAPNKQRTAASPTAGASVDLGDQLQLVTWPNYHDPANFEEFQRQTGVKVNVTVFGSNEEMLAKLQVGSTGWDVYVPTNYTIPTYAKLDLIEPLDLSRITTFDPTKYEQRFLDASKAPGDDTTYAIPKDWGTTGYAYWADLAGDDPGSVDGAPGSWVEFWGNTMGPWSGKVTIHDYQLTAIGNALLNFGYDFGSVDPNELAKAESLLIDVKPHLFAITSDYQPPMRAKDAWVAMAWTGDAEQMNRDHPQIKYALGREGGEVWEDNWAIVKSAPHKDAAYAFLQFMIDPKIAAKETLFHGYPQVDQRATALLPEEITGNPIVYPPQEQLAQLEFGANVTLTDPNRAELWARVKSA